MTPLLTAASLEERLRAALQPTQIEVQDDSHQHLSLIHI